MEEEQHLLADCRRIGDILAGIPDSANAVKAYDEARELYKYALKGSRDPAAIKVIEAEIAQLPKTSSR